MASKTANVVARVEPEIKRQAEEILDELGIPVSVVINALYRQIIYTKSVPFMVKKPRSLEDMTEDELKELLQQGIKQGENGEVTTLAKCMADIRNGR